MSTDLETATLGAGCFWCIEAIYQNLKGVETVVSGYTGGKTENPTYQEICMGTTGHAEVAQITFDPEVITFKEILMVFWRTHDPTTLNQQGNDVGTQYRSAIFYHTEEQKSIAEQSLKETDESTLWTEPIVTEISPLRKFYPGEDYHQNYFNNNPYQPYCQAIIGPKLKKFKNEFQDQLK
ncbi:MAG: peptide-methionine (S)-S-oxide reductase MsrA [SAR324 cluster bacterium]|nr:peptide-methionine (S)-S-oxide reductase MsrA [SAR324 cluster bacterium]